MAPLKNTKPIPMVSVIIPVYNDPWRLLKTIRALLYQTYPLNRYEVIVIDNGSNNGLIPLLSRFKNVVLTREAKEGAYAARNMGISIAKGDIIAFTDSDCIPHPDWIENGVRTFQNSPACALVAGQIDFFYKVSGCPTAIELYDHLTALPQNEFVENEHYGATANLFVTKSSFEKAGFFDASLKSEGGDAELGHKIFKMGMALIFNSNAIVQHPARNTLKALVRKSRRATIGTQMTIEKYNYHKRNLFLYVNYHLIERPNQLNRKMLKTNPYTSFLMRFKVILIYFLIKILQVFERLRIGLGEKPIR